MSRNLMLVLLIVSISLAGLSGFEANAEESYQRDWNIYHDRGMYGGYEYRNGDHMYIYISLYNYDSAFSADIYIGIIDTFGRVWTLDWDAWKQGNYAYYKQALIPQGLNYPPTFVNEVLFPLEAPIPLGTYTLGIAVVEVGTSMTQDDIRYETFYVVE